MNHCCKRRADTPYDREAEVSAHLAGDCRGVLQHSAIMPDKGESRAAECLP
jgi:hypothetical protein